MVTGSFEVWSGAGCDQYANRSPSAVTKTCTLLVGGLGTIDTILHLHFRDMVAAYGATVTAGKEECDLPQTAGLLTRTIYFVVADPNTNASLIATTPTWGCQVRHPGQPPPPSSVTAESRRPDLGDDFLGALG